MFYLYHNKPAIIRNLASLHGYDYPVRRLLELLSTKELIILGKHKDLMERVQAISEMSEEECGDVLEKHYDVTVDNWAYGEIWLGNFKIRHRVPDWFDHRHVGWFFNDEGKDFFLWAQKFLLQEVKINIWMRYIEHRKEKAKAAAELEEQQDFGMICG